MIFHSDKFIFDGKHSDELGLMLVDTTSVNSLDDYGTVYNEDIKSDHSYGNNPFYTHKENIPERFTLEFALVDRGIKPIRWDNDLEEKIINLFMQDKFCEFVTFDYPNLTYYLRGVKATKKKTHKKEGILAIEFQPYYQYPIQKFRKNILIDGEKTIRIENPSISSDYLYPLIIVEVKDDCDFEIENISIKDSRIFKLKGLKKDQTIKVDNQLYIVTDDKDNNLFHIANREWFKLKKGLNEIKIKGKVRIKIHYNCMKRV